MTVIQELGEYKNIELARDADIVEEHREAIANKGSMYARRMSVDSKTPKLNKHNVFSKYYQFTSVPHFSGINLTPHIEETNFFFFWS